MNIAMFTNAYPPHVGGVASSVSRSVRGFRQSGHRVLVVAPRYEEESEEEPEEDILRLQSIKNISGSDFSLPLPFSVELRERLDRFEPDIIHSHYPILIGDMALRYGALKGIPVVFTHHTRYEAYEGLLPWDLEGFEELVNEIATGYANLCNQVIAPTAGMVKLLRENGVKTAISAIPTGVDIDRFSTGEGTRCRRVFGIGADRFIAGYIGRLAPEKNLDFWSEAVCKFLKGAKRTHALVVGEGECENDIRNIFEQHGLSERLTMTGVLEEGELVDAYHAMDIFAFTSTRETQGLVLVEALACGCPVAALDVRCVRDVVSDGVDGHLVKSHNPDAFANILKGFARMSDARYDAMSRAARHNAQRFNINTCITKILHLYSELLDERRPNMLEVTGWPALMEFGKREVKLWKNRLGALANLIAG